MELVVAGARRGVWVGADKLQARLCTGFLGHFSEIVRVNPDKFCTVVRVYRYTGIALVVESPGLSDRLVKRMESVGIGVRALAKRSGVNKGTISAWHSGAQTSVRVATAVKVAAALGTSVEDLLDLPPADEEEPPDALAHNRVSLLRRVAALAPAVEALEDPTTELARALAANGEKLARLEDVLQQLRDLVDDARSVSGSKDDS